MTHYNAKLGRLSDKSEASVNIPKRLIQGQSHPRRRLWALGGGKGGIGKTLLTSNMAVYLSWLNKRVVVIDMDLGGANLHTALGVENPQTTLSDFVLGRVKSIQDAVQPTPIKNLSILSGAQDPVGIANMRHMHKMRLLRKFREIDADFILMDLGAGTSLNTLDFFLLADEKIVIITPEPTSIENGYRFIKSTYYRMLRAATPSPYVRQLIEQAMDQKNTRGISSPKELLQEVARLSPQEGTQLENRMKAFHISLVVNQVRGKSESELGRSIEMVCERYFGMSIDCMGYLPYDNAVWKSVRHRLPFILDAPNSPVVTHLESILRNLIRRQDKN